MKQIKRLSRLWAILLTFGLILLSVPEVFIEAKHGIENYGYIGGLLIGAYYVHKAVLRHKFQERDKRWEADYRAILANQRVLMALHGVSDQWHGPHETLKSMDLLNSGRSFFLSRKAINRGNPSRRTMKMNQSQVNLATLTPGIIAVLKLALQPFGIEIPDEHINAIVNGAAALMAVIAVFMSHRKPKTQPIASKLPQTYNQDSFQ
jgi:uncharacterized membrane protein